MCGTDGLMAVWVIVAAPFLTDSTEAAKLQAGQVAAFSHGAFVCACRDLGREISAVKKTIATAAEFADLTKRLDDDSYEIREKAASRLRELSAQPSTASLMAEWLDGLLASESISIETRCKLEQLRDVLPAAAPLGLPPDEIRRLLRRIDSESGQIRAAAIARLGDCGRILRCSARCWTRSTIVSPIQPSAAQAGMQSSRLKAMSTAIGC